MGTPGPFNAASRLVVVSFNGRCRRFDLDGEGRLSFAHIARVFRIPFTAPDECDAWTLDDTSLRIDKSDPGALLSTSALRELFPLPAGTSDQPLVLRTEDAEGPSPGKEAALCQQLRQHGRSGGTPGRKGEAQRAAGGQPAAQFGRSPARSPATAAAAATLRSNQPSPSTRSATAAAAVVSPRRSGMVTPRPRHAAGAQEPAGPGYQTPGAASPLRGARTPTGLALVPHLPPVPSCRGLRRMAPLELELSKPLLPDSELLKHPKGQGTFFFTPAAAQHLPMLMACHLPPPLQRMLRCFSVGAQCVITARAMALYATTSDAEYFKDQRLEAALTEARSRNPPQDRYCAYSQALRLTGRKRKPAASPHPAGGGGGPSTPIATRGSAAHAAASADVDMDAGGWAFIGAATLHCPGGAACRKAGRHENWLLSDGEDGRVTYLPVLYDSEEHSAVLLPLADPRVGAEPRADSVLVWFRFEYESRAGRRGHNFWDRGLPEHLEQAVRDVAGEAALRAAQGA